MRLANYLKRILPGIQEQPEIEVEIECHKGERCKLVGERKSQDEYCMFKVVSEVAEILEPELSRCEFCVLTVYKDRVHSAPFSPENWNKSKRIGKKCIEEWKKMWEIS